MNSNEFISFFQNITSGENKTANTNKPNHSSTTEFQEELDYLWSEYQSYLTHVKENYKVMRNENGKHRLEKN